MSNMSYCRFVNTYMALLDCYEHMEIIVDISKPEKEYREKLINLCVDIAREYQELDSEDDYELVQHE